LDIIDFHFMEMCSWHNINVILLIATLIIVYGILLPAMGWLLAAIIWVEALTVFFIIDALKYVITKY
jgi:hypothetical protein